MPLSTITRGFRKLANRLERRSQSRVVRESLRRAGLSHATGIHTFTVPDELRTLLDLAGNVPDNGHVIEIGSYVGASTCYLAAGIFGRGATIHCVDTWQNEGMPDGTRDTYAEFQKNLAPVAAQVRTIRKPSGKLTRDDCPYPIDLAFLDGYHSYDTTLLDFKTVSPWMAPGGIIAMHDTRCWQGVSRALGEVLLAGQWRVVGQVYNMTWLERARWDDAITVSEDSQPIAGTTHRQGSL
jgi:predicted O-methyltransferase YrrM